MVCYNGEVTVEPCADFRQEVCVESEIGDYSVAACKANAWEDCYVQDNEEDCEDLDVRDCKWINSGVEDDDDDDEDKTTYHKICVPKYAPGFNFWEEGDAEDLCEVASEQCTVTYEKVLASGWKCIENCHCCYGYDDCTGREEHWETKKIDFCHSLGDCGFTTDYLGGEGKFNASDLFRKNSQPYLEADLDIDDIIRALEGGNN